MLLTRLASFYWRPDFGPAQAAAMIEDFVADVCEFPIPEIGAALQEYRRNPKNKFYPTPGAIREIILEGRAERASMEKIGAPISNFDSRPIMWWALSKPLWRDHWLEADIPQEHRAAYERKKRKAA
jgi:hypothetical protein